MTVANIRIGTADVCAQPEGRENDRKPGHRPGDL
jgi:hypothetical protein